MRPISTRERMIEAISCVVALVALAGGMWAAVGPLPLGAAPAAASGVPAVAIAER